MLSIHYNSPIWEPKNTEIFLVGEIVICITREENKKKSDLPEPKATIVKAISVTQTDIDCFGNKEKNLRHIILSKGILISGKIQIPLQPRDCIDSPSPT